MKNETAVVPPVSLDPRCLVRLKTLCLVGMGIYICLNIVDFILTFALIRVSGGVAYESNPIAAACLERYGWEGLAFFKLGGVLAFVAATVLMLSRSPRVAAGVVALGCAVLLSVTSYSYSLLEATRREYAELDRVWGRSTYNQDSDPVVACIPSRYEFR